MTLETVTSLISLTACVCVWSYSTFQTKEHARDRYAHIDKRLDVIEEMLRELIRK